VSSTRPAGFPPVADHVTGPATSPTALQPSVPVSNVLILDAAAWWGNATTEKITAAAVNFANLTMYCFDMIL
jgi:hypothetical protein